MHGVLGCVQLCVLQARGLGHAPSVLGASPDLAPAQTLDQTTLSLGGWAACSTRECMLGDWIPVLWLSVHMYTALGREATAAPKPSPRPVCPHVAAIRLKAVLHAHYGCSPQTRPSNCAESRSHTPCQPFLGGTSQPAFSERMQGLAASQCCQCKVGLASKQNH